ncbi:hypothetical protein ABTO87_06350 [Acinetobacter baumannii]
MQSLQSLQPRISVAPMMDWINKNKIKFSINSLQTTIKIMV